MIRAAGRRGARAVLGAAVAGVALAASPAIAHDVPPIVPGRSIAGIRLGETYAELTRSAKHYGGSSVSDLGLVNAFDHRVAWSVEVGVPYLYRGDYLAEDTIVSIPAGSQKLWTHKPPPPSARVARVSTVSPIERTPSGAGWHSTLAQLRRLEPRGHLYVEPGGPPLAWLVEGPGRRRTAFMLFKGIVQDVVLGCRQTDPKQIGAPVAEDLVC
jgi:hypothetical protein